MEKAVIVREVVIKFRDVGLASQVVDPTSIRLSTTFLEVVEKQGYALNVGLHNLYYR